MEYLFASIKSEFEKVKRGIMLLLHFLLPILASLIFLVYYSTASFKASSMAGGFLQMLAIIFPLVIAIVCSMAVEQEASAGNFQQMLTFHKRITSYISKLAMIILLGLGAILLCICSFGAGFMLVLHKSPFGFGYYIYSALILFFSSAFLYVLHYFISLKFGGMPSIGLGIFESLLAALFNTGLGDGKWEFVPCTWGMRFIMNFNRFMIKSSSSSKGLSELHLAIILCILGTVAITIITCIWFLHWEGRKSE